MLCEGKGPRGDELSHPFAGGMQRAEHAIPVISCCLFDAGGRSSQSCDLLLAQDVVCANGTSDDSPPSVVSAEVHV